MQYRLSKTLAERAAWEFIEAQQGQSPPTSADAPEWASGADLGRRRSCECPAQAELTWFPLSAAPAQTPTPCSWRPSTRVSSRVRGRVWCHAGPGMTGARSLSMSKGNMGHCNRRAPGRPIPLNRTIKRVRARACVCAPRLAAINRKDSQSVRSRGYPRKSLDQTAQCELDSFFTTSS